MTINRTLPLSLKNIAIGISVLAHCFAAGLVGAAEMDWSRHRLIAHALGGIDGKIYTDSKDALELNYRNGHRLFEVDLILTRDNVLVARHDWSEGFTKALDQAIVDEGGIPNESVFRSLKINYKYDPLTMEDLAKVMQSNADIYLITDTKSVTVQAVEEQFALLVATVRKVDERLLARIIPQIYNQGMLPAVKKSFDFENIIYTLYQTSDGDESVLRFCLENRIHAVAMSPSRYSKAFCAALRTNNIRVYVHTINSPDEAERFFEDGVFGLYTDFLVPADVNAMVRKVH